MPREPKDPEAADLTSWIVDLLNGSYTEINGRDYAVLACHEADNEQTVFLELVDISSDEQGPNESIEYRLKIAKRKK